MDMSKETIKAFAEIDKAIDESFLKLSDKFHDLTLSHNRKKKALLDILEIVENDLPGYNPNPAFYADIFVRIRRLCDSALFSDGRDVINGKTGIQHRKKITMRDIKKGVKNG